MYKIKTVTNSKLLKNSLWLMVLQIFNTIVPLLSIPYVTRVLGATEYGNFSLALNWILYFQVIVEYGFGYLGAKKVAIMEEKQLQKIFSGLITARIILLFLSFLLMNVIFWLSGMDRKHYICMIILFLMVIGGAFQLTWLFQGKQDMKFITIVNCLAKTVSVLLVFIVINQREDVYLYSFLYSITFILSAIIGFILASLKYGLQLKLCNLNYAVELLREGWSLFVSQAMSKILSGVGTTILGFVSVASLVGVYSAIYKIPLSMALLFSPISQALFPHISIEFRKSYKIGLTKVKKISLLFVPIFTLLVFVIIVYRNGIVSIAFGEEYKYFSNVLIPLSLWFLFSMINNLLGIQTLIASGHQNEYSKAFLLGACLSIALNIILGVIWELYGVAWATFISEFILTIVLCLVIKKIFRRKVCEK